MKGFKKLIALLTALTMSTATLFAFGCVDNDGKKDVIGNINGIISNAGNNNGNNNGTDGEPDYEIGGNDYPKEACSYNAAIEIINGTGRNLGGFGLGYCYNAVKAPYFGFGEIQTGETVFDEDFLASKLKEVERVNYANSENVGFVSYGIDDMVQRFKSYEFNCNYNSALATAEHIANRLTGEGSAINYNDYASTFFKVFYSTARRYGMYFPGYMAKISEYSENLSSEYLSALDSVFEGKMTYESLFDKYGTHVVMQGIYGGRIFYCYSAASNQYDFDKCGYAVNSVLNNYMSETRPDGLVSAPVVRNILKCDYNMQERFYGCTVGGNVSEIDGFESFYDAVQNFAKTVDNYAMLIDTTDSGLVPLWKLLPEKYESHSTEFERALNEYIYSNK